MSLVNSLVDASIMSEVLKDAAWSMKVEPSLVEHTPGRTDTDFPPRTVYVHPEPRPYMQLYFNRRMRCVATLVVGGSRSKLLAQAENHPLLLTNDSSTEHSSDRWSEGTSSSLPFEALSPPTSSQSISSQSSASFSSSTGANYWHDDTLPNRVQFATEEIVWVDPIWSTIDGNDYSSLISDAYNQDESSMGSNSALTQTMARSNGCCYCCHLMTADKGNRLRKYPNRRRTKLFTNRSTPARSTRQYLTL
jgi:hypothetical protein